MSNPFLDDLANNVAGVTEVELEKAKTLLAEWPRPKGLELGILPLELQKLWVVLLHFEKILDEEEQRFSRSEGLVTPEKQQARLEKLTATYKAVQTIFWASVSCLYDSWNGHLQMTEGWRVFDTNPPCGACRIRHLVSEVKGFNHSRMGQVTVRVIRL